MHDRTNDTHATGSQVSRPYLRHRVANSPRSELDTSRIEVETLFNKHRHITWNEAWSAESKREQARLTSCLEIPTAGPIRLLVANIARELPRARARTLRYFTWIVPGRAASASGHNPQTIVNTEEQGNYYLLKSEQARRLPGDANEQPPSIPSIKEGA